LDEVIKWGHLVYLSNGAVVRRLVKAAVGFNATLGDPTRL
jgi:hypothetical protein